ncbi:hypothetical protein BCR33DRAFT_428083 [Rhizoclosmatium globosum]|uniref:Uncharacterized protein n=1 Tax=Rhizoclosmatium globosum TaxID=329046 RepID=A0A1Y2BV95_9FUNG|nr:hypothetical protein BCR33DRAFT_428083 [Rhizoclosmatium globosum]|eukprot:ORY38698.1 hypothetical protein BCR33DRAFT_428083 [Rhizoclosmatium globosum]
MEAKTEPATTTLPFQVPSNNVRLKSCEQCRIAKRRCLPDNSTTAQVGEHRVCIRCKHLGITCVFSKNRFDKSHTLPYQTFLLNSFLHFYYLPPQKTVPNPKSFKIWLQRMAGTHHQEAKADCRT